MVDTLKEVSEPLLDSRSIIPHHVRGESILNRFTNASEISEGGDWRRIMSSPSSRLPSQPALSAMCLHSEETNASPPSKGIPDFIRILLLMYGYFSDWILSAFANLSHRRFNFVLERNKMIVSTSFGQVALEVEFR
mmetsp:Transcript_1653/g.3444  ORF Transcript_1653/g.3444 Transcript_1653/m.3444 type:complete len:136 (-) Transcript_1653:26-433(-)